MGEVPVFAVYRDEIARRLADRDLELFLAGVAGHVEGPAARKKRRRRPSGKFVYHHRMSFSFPGWATPDDDPVAGADLDLPVCPESHAIQGGEGLSLAARGYYDEFALRYLADTRDIDEGPVRDVDIPEPYGQVQNVFHGAAGYGHFPAVLDGGFDDLLDAVHVGGERRDDQALVRTLEELVERLADRPLDIVSRRSALVESESRSATEFADVQGRSSGPAQVSSIAKSPVWTMVPIGVKMARARVGRQWLTLSPRS